MKKNKRQERNGLIDDYEKRIKEAVKNGDMMAFLKLNREKADILRAAERERAQ